MARRTAVCHPDRTAHAKDLCSACYANLRYANNASVREQKSRYAKTRREQHPTKIKREKHRWYENNRERILTEAAAWWRNLPPNKQREKWLRHRYGLTYADYSTIIEKQNGKCPVCKQALVEEPFKSHIDHNHETDEVRGVLCHRCNALVGWIETSGEQLVESAKEYLNAQR